MMAPCRRFALPNLAAAVLLLAPAAAQTTTRVSVSSAGAEGNNHSRSPAPISADGRYVAFDSGASNLVPGDTNYTSDVFVRDRSTGQTSRVSVDSAGLQGNESSWNPSISADGRYVAFTSRASNLVPGDTNLTWDVFVHDRLTAQTSRVSVSSAGSQADHWSQSPAISGDGRCVAFTSFATNLVPSDTNGTYDVFLHDRQIGQTLRISVDSNGGQGNNVSDAASVSADGRFVAFSSHASNLVPGDTNGYADAFVHDRAVGATMRVSVDAAGGQGNYHSFAPSISANGRWVAFSSAATTFVPGDTNGVNDVFVHDRLSGQITRVSVSASNVQADGSNDMPKISADGFYVVFHSYATNLVPGDTNRVIDVILHERLTGILSRVSVRSSGGQGNQHSVGPAISADGGCISFSSLSNNLVAGDMNQSEDVFLHDRDTTGLNLAKAGSCPGPMTLTISHATAGGPVAIVHGPAGRFVKPASPCQGIVLEVSPPSLGVILNADGSGSVVLNINAPPGACGRSVQGVDQTTCSVTNVIVL